MIKHGLLYLHVLAIFIIHSASSQSEPKTNAEPQRSNQRSIAPLDDIKSIESFDADRKKGKGPAIGLDESGEYLDKIKSYREYVQSFKNKLSNKKQEKQEGESAPTNPRRQRPSWWTRKRLTSADVDSSESAEEGKERSNPFDASKGISVVVESGSDSTEAEYPAPHVRGSTRSLDNTFEHE